MLCFFAMGFVDLVGIASNYVKADLNLSDSMANTLPSLVFLWFLIFSIPTSLLMNKIGRKNTVLVSLVMTIASLLVPIFTLDFTMLLLSFSLLGICLLGRHHQRVRLWLASALSHLFGSRCVDYLAALWNSHQRSSCHAGTEACRRAVCRLLCLTQESFCAALLPSYRMPRWH